MCARKKWGNAKIQTSNSVAEENLARIKALREKNMSVLHTHVCACVCIGKRKNMLAVALVEQTPYGEITNFVVVLCFNFFHSRPIDNCEQTAVPTTSLKCVAKTKALIEFHTLPRLSELT